MDKILVNVTCAALGESYDAFVPKAVTVGQAAVLLGKTMEEVSNQRYVASGTELICADDGRRLLDRSAIFGTCGIENGDRLVLY